VPPDGSAPKPLAQFTRADQVAIEPVDWLIEGWLAKDSLAGLVGPSGACKSFLAIDWACRVATGTPWCGRDVSKGAVFVLAGEGRNGLRKRIEGWSRHTGVSIEGAPLYLSANMPPMTNPVNAAAVIAEMDELAERVFFENGGVEPSLIVIDTVARAMAGKNENSAQDMGELVMSMDWLRERWGAAVLAIHHTGHEAATRARGSSSFYAALDSEAVLKPGKSDGLLLTATKCKDWQPPIALALQPRTVEIALPGTDRDASTLVLVSTGIASAVDDRQAQVRALRDQGLTVRKIADQTGVPRSTVDRMLKTANPVWVEEFGDDPM
jgi:ribosomal protein S11